METHLLAIYYAYSNVNEVLITCTYIHTFSLIIYCKLPVCKQELLVYILSIGQAMIDNKENQAQFDRI